MRRNQFLNKRKGWYVCKRCKDNRAATYGLDATGRPGVTGSRPTLIYQWGKPGEPGSQDHYCGLSGDDESQANGSSILQVPTDQWRTSLVPQGQGGAGAWNNRAAKYGLDATGRPGVTKSRPNVIYQWS